MQLEPFPTGYICHCFFCCLTRTVTGTAASVVSATPVSIDLIYMRMRYRVAQLLSHYNHPSRITVRSYEEACTAAARMVSSFLESSQMCHTNQYFLKILALNVVSSLLWFAHFTLIIPTPTNRHTLITTPTSLPHHF